MESFDRIVVSAPSKIILHGEHGVVYGKSAVAGSLDLRTRMSIKRERKQIIRVDFPDVGVSNESWTYDDVRDILESEDDGLDKIGKLLSDRRDRIQSASLTCFFYLYKLILDGRFVGLSISVESEIPIGAGLGSSAALSVCLAAGLLSVGGQRDSGNEEIVSRYAFLSEKIIHGRPSGVDNSVSAYGGLIQFKDGVVKRIESSVRLKVLLVESGVQRSTKQIVESVRDRFAQRPKVVGPILEAIDGVSEEFLSVLKRIEDEEPVDSDYEEIEDLIEYNHSLLRALGVSHRRIEEIVSVSRSFKLRGVKLTGAGGGGFAYILIPPSISECSLTSLKDALEKRGFNRPRETSIGVSGLEIKSFNEV